MIQLEMDLHEKMNWNSWDLKNVSESSNVRLFNSSPQMDDENKAKDRVQAGGEPLGTAMTNENGHEGDECMGQIVGGSRERRNGLVVVAGSSL